MRQYFLKRQNQTSGPFTSAQLKEMARDGRLKPDDLLSYPGGPNPAPAGTISELFGVSSFPTPVPSAPAKAAPVLEIAPAPVSSAAPQVYSLPPAPAKPQASPMHAKPQAASTPVIPDTGGTSGWIRSLLSLPKPILFGLFGAAGGFLGSLLFGDLLWLLLRPAELKQEPEVRLGIPAEVAVYAGQSNRFTVKVAREQFAGPIVITADKTPKGIRVGKVVIAEDKDEGDVRVEVRSDAQPGTHKIQLHGAAEGKDEVLSNAGSITVKVEPPPVALRIAVSPVVSVLQGGKTRFSVRAARDDIDKEITFQYHNVPPGVSISALSLAEGKSQGEAEVIVPRNQATGSWPIRVAAVGQYGSREVKTEESFKLEIKERPQPVADIVFVLDITGSMQPQINGIKDGIKQFVAGLSNKDVDARIALVGFRDAVADRNWLVQPKVGGEYFTKDFDAFGKQVGTIRAGGGAGGPASALQGLAEASKLPFRDNASRVFVLISDEPPKLHPNTVPKTVPDAIELMQGSKIQQVHLIVHKHHLRQYSPFQKEFKGSYFDFQQVLRQDAFAGILPKLSEEIATTTIAAQPTLPDAAPPPALPQATGGSLPPPTTVEAVKGVLSTQKYAAGPRLVVAIAIWTGIVAAGISLFVLAGQTFYARQTWVPLPDALRVIAGGLAAGLIGGAAGQLFFQLTGG